MVIGLVILSHPKGGEDASWHLWCHTNLEEKMARCAILILLGLNLYRMLDPILIASIILGYDIWFYISHLILHMPWFFKNIHKEHHALIPKKMTFTDAYVGHRSEGIFQCLGIFLPFALFKPAKNSIRTADLYSSWFVTDNNLNSSTFGADFTRRAGTARLPSGNVKRCKTKHFISFFWFHPYVFSHDCLP